LLEKNSVHLLLNVFKYFFGGIEEGGWGKTKEVGSCNHQDTSNKQINNCWREHSYLPLTFSTTYLTHTFRMSYNTNMYNLKNNNCIVYLEMLYDTPPKPKAKIKSWHGGHHPWQKSWMRMRSASRPSLARDWPLYPRTRPQDVDCHPPRRAGESQPFLFFSAPPARNWILRPPLYLFHAQLHMHAPHDKLECFVTGGIAASVPRAVGHGSPPPFCLSVHIPNFADQARSRAYCAVQCPQLRSSLPAKDGSWVHDDPCSSILQRDISFVFALFFQMMFTLSLKKNQYHIYL
jgi:hypothetical protein